MSRLQLIVDRSLLFAIKRAAMREDLYMRDYIIKVLATAVGWEHDEAKCWQCHNELSDPLLHEDSIHCRLCGARQKGVKHETTDEEAARGVADSLRAWGSRRIGNPGVEGRARANGDGVREVPAGATAGAGAVPRGKSRIKKMTAEEFFALSRSDQDRAKREGRYP